MTKSRAAWWSLGGLAVAGSAGLAAYLLAVRPWHRRWGASDKEVAADMPGDEMVPDANLKTTRAITIRARPETVWPWLVQIGQGRGGLYSYDLLENLMGLDIHSATRILPDLQDLQVGDRIPLEPGGGGYTVAELEPNRHLVLFTEGAGESDMDEVFRQANAASTWALLLEPLDDGVCTRLVVRWRARWDLLSSPTSFLIGVVLDPIEFVMEQKMMKGIKQRAEATPGREMKSVCRAQRLDGQ
jgi:hypothetical protein